MIDMETTCKGYTVTVEHKPSGESVTVTLSDTSDKWIVRGEGYQGFFKDLDSAYREACRHLKFKIGEKVN